MTDTKASSPSKGWDKKNKLVWEKLLRAKDWQGAAEMAQDAMFNAADFTRRVPVKASMGAGPWGQSFWFEKCKDEQALNSVLDRAQEAPSMDGAGRKRPLLTKQALIAAVGANNEIGLRILQNRAPKLFSDKKAFEEGLDTLLRSDEWVPADAAPALKTRLVALQGWFPFFDAQKLIASWAVPETFYGAAMGLGPDNRGEPGRAAVARLAFEEAGLDPWARVDLTRTAHPKARLALMALNRETPDLFLEFVRVGVSPDELKLEGVFDRQDVFWPQGVFGSPWMEFSWPQSIDADAPKEPKPLASPLGGGARPILMMSRRHQPRIRAGLSARFVIDAGIAAKSPNSATQTIRALERMPHKERQAIWRAGWEAHCLREAVAAAAAPSQTGEPGVLGAKNADGAAASASGPAIPPKARKGSRL